MATVLLFLLLVHIKNFLLRTVCSLDGSRIEKLSVKSLLSGTAESVSFEILKLGVNYTISSKLQNALM